MTTVELQEDALARARGSLSTMNYRTIITGFMEKGIKADDIEPRVNVLTFQAWRALGRHVRKGEHGVNVLTWIPVADKKDKITGEIVAGGRRPKGATVFHISQTDADTVPNE